MDKNQTDVKQAVVELTDNLGTIGVFMLGEARAFLRKSWGASIEEFSTAIDQAARAMKQSGKLAFDDIDRAAEKIKESWGLLDQEKDLDWDNFLNDLKNRLNAIGEISKETFDLCVNQTAQVLDKQWTALGRIGENQVKQVQAQVADISTALKSQWGVFCETMQQTGNKIDRAVDAAWKEIKKND